MKATSSLFAVQSSKGFEDVFERYSPSGAATPPQAVDSLGFWPKPSRHKVLFVAARKLPNIAVFLRVVAVWRFRRGVPTMKAVTPRPR